MLRRWFGSIRPTTVIDEEIQEIVRKLRTMGSEGAAVLITPDHVSQLAETTPPARLYQMGQAIFENSRENIAQSLLLWKAAMDKGHLNAKFSYARCLRDGTGFPKPDPITATALFKHLYEAKNAWGTYAYAEALNSGEGTRQNKAKAFELYLACAKADLPPAYMAVANMYASGQGVEKNTAEAVVWYTKASSKGDAHAKSILGDWYYNGINVNQDIPLGLELRRGAASAGVPNALFNMGCLHQAGENVDKDDSVAYQLFQQAAMKGHAMAMFNVAIMLRDGIGVAANHDAAKKWLEALAPYDIHAKEMLDEMVKSNEKS